MIPQRRRAELKGEAPLSPATRLILQVLAEREETSEPVTVGQLYQDYPDGELKEEILVGLLRDMEEARLVAINGNRNSSTASLTLLEAGRNRLAMAGATKPLSQRVSVDLLRDLGELTRRELVPRSTLVAQLLEEAVRVRLFPEVEFRGKACDRRPFLAGTRLSPWFVRTMFLQHGENMERLLKNYPHLSQLQVLQGIEYANRYAHETPPELPPPAWIPRFHAGE